MNQFFAGGLTPVSTAYQDINVSANATDINAGKVTCDLTGYLGGFDVDNDNATLQVSFYNGLVKISDGPTIGPVLAVDRGNITGLFFRYQCGIPVPANTTSLRVTLTLTRTNGAFNDGYADSLSLVLRAPAIVTTNADSGAGSLRAAMTAGNIITFDPNLYATGAVINLLSPLPTLVGGMSLIGPGSKLLTIQRDSSAFSLRIFSVNYTNPPYGVVVSGVTIAHGTTDINEGGGGMYINGTGTTTVNNCVFSGNNAGFGGGGAIENNGYLLKLNSCTFTNNSAALTAGGAIANLYSTIATSCLFKGNTSSGAAVIFNYGNISLTGCLFTENTGYSTIENSSIESVSNFYLTNCTFSANSPTTADVYNRAGNTVNDDAYIIISSCTFVSPAAVYNDQSGGFTETFIANSIFKSTGGSNLTAVRSGDITSQGYNMSNDGGSGVLTYTGDRVNTDPMLGPLQNNGGPTMTHALLAGSLAIDKGNALETTDQRGAPRPYDDPNSANGGGNNSDIGAYEYGSTAPAIVNSAALGNISTRVLVQTGDKVAIAGFIVTGTQPKKVIVRALGPSLTQHGVSGALANPTLELRDGNGALLASNNNWKDTDQAAIQASNFAPSNDLESAILATLPSNGSRYTAVVQGANSTTGVGLVEVYDLNRNSSDSRPGNISTRGFVGTGSNVMIGGFVVVGSNNQQVLVRGMGPSLTAFGVQGALSDPTLELRDVNGTLVASNNNWKDTQQAAIQATGFAPSNDLESAILRALVPGSYTAVVQGMNGATGVALVEVYTFKP